MRVVIDTNAFVSAILFEGPTSALLTLWQKRKILVLVSRDIIDEYLRVLTYPKFKLTKREIRFVLNRELLPYAVLIQPKARIKAAPDPDDDEHECILRGAWQIAAKGGRNQLALLLKGSKNKSLLKHGLDRSPVYGKLSFLTIEEIENRIDQLIRKGELRTEFFGDLPLILMTDESWANIRPWAHRYECEQAASADPRRLNEILLDWRNRRREEQYQLLEAMASIDSESARRVFEMWRELPGKEMRSRIENKLVPK